MSALAVAALVAWSATFVGGYLTGKRDGSDFRTSTSLSMRGTPASPAASASIEIGNQDASGNRPLLVRVRGLTPLPVGGYYELFLTRRHRPAVSCGTFVAHGATTVRLNAPYHLQEFDGWVVTLQLPGLTEPGPVVLTTF